MASASSTSAKNLFQDSKRRLAERVQVNINNVGSVTRQVQRGSRSHDMLAQTARNFCQTETTMENTFNNLQKMQVLMAQLNQQENSMDDNLRHLPDIREQIRDMQRYFLPSDHLLRILCFSSNFPFVGLLGFVDLGSRFVAQRGASPVFLDFFGSFVVVGLDSLN